MDLNLYDAIGPGDFGLIDDKIVAEVLSEADGEDIRLRINSPGGDVYKGLAIYNQLREYSGKVTARVDSLSASIASVIMLAAEDVEVAEGADVMIHDPYTLAQGNSAELRLIADRLDSVADKIAGIYERRTKLSRDEASQLMTAETWMGPEEAVERGFADRIDVGEVRVAACVRGFDEIMHWRHMPARLVAEKQQSRPRREAKAALTDRTIALHRQIRRQRAKLLTESIRGPGY